jgi:hypothetical protein
MTADDKARGDQFTTDFFEDILTTYLEDGEIESAVVRLDLDDGTTRRFVIEDETEALDPYEYLQRELEELRYLLEENQDALSTPVELSIPVADTDRVVEDAREEDAVTTMVQPSGVSTILECMREQLEKQTAETSIDQRSKD